MCGWVGVRVLRGPSCEGRGSWGYDMIVLLVRDATKTICNTAGATFCASSARFARLACLILCVSLLPLHDSE